jgi:hypothetical protein
LLWALLASAAVVAVCVSSSEPASARAGLRPVVNSQPAVSGQPVLGRTLVGSLGSWSGTRPIRYARQWRRCNRAGGACRDIASAGAKRYVLTPADVGARLRLRVTAKNAHGSRQAVSRATATVTRPAESPVIAAAGDIACDTVVATATTCAQKATSDLLVNRGLAGVLALGDLQYENGELANFDAYYDPTWGRVKAITYPAPGNHEYNIPGAAGYFGYFDSRTSWPGYYSFDIGSWHLIALNSNCAEVGGCDAASPQTRWLEGDLAAHRNACTLAFWHHPRFSSGAAHGSRATYQPWWQVLYEAGADVVLAGHEHLYERFAPQTPTGVADAARGIRQFTVGTGGKAHHAFGAIAANSEVRNADTFGVLELTLKPAGYAWRFVPEPGKAFADTGSGVCH